LILTPLAVRSDYKRDNVSLSQQATTCCLPARRSPWKGDQEEYSCRTAAIIDFTACVKNILMDITVYLLKGTTEIILQIRLFQGQMTTLNCALHFTNP